LLGAGKPLSTSPPGIHGLFIPSARVVAHAVAKAEEKSPELFGPPVAPVKGDWGHYNERILKQFRLVKMLVVGSMSPTGYRESGLRIWKCYQNKTELIKTLQAAEYVYGLAKQEDAVRLISAMHNAHSIDFQDLDVVCATGPGETAMCTAILNLMNIYCWMLLMALRPAHPDKEEGTACRLLRAPVPPECFSSAIAKTFGDLDAMAKDVTPGPAGSLEPEWLEANSCLSLVTTKYLRDISLYDKDISWGGGGHHRTCIRAQFAFREFLCSVVATLKSDIEMASVLQTKVLGSAATAAFSVISYLIHNLSKIDS